MKPNKGDTVYAPMRVEAVAGTIVYGDWDMVELSLVLPSHPALPAVAEWLAANPNGLRAIRDQAMGNESGDSDDYQAVDQFFALVNELEEIK